MRSRLFSYYPVVDPVDWVLAMVQAKAAILLQVAEHIVSLSFFSVLNNIRAAFRELVVVSMVSYFPFFNRSVVLFFFLLTQTINVPGLASI